MLFSPKNPCQSCGMPLAKDPQKGGLESDGTRSKLYCSHCYHLGSFTEPDMTVHTMMKKVEDKLVEMWIPRFIAKLFTKQLPNFKRWKH